MKNHWTPFLAVLVLLNCKITFAQQPTPMKQESHKYRTILTVAGGGGGFALGLFGGLAAFDDATNSDRKVWTTAALSAAGGAVAGYFLGRSFDKGSRKTGISRASDEFYQRLTGSQKPFHRSKNQEETTMSISLSSRLPIGPIGVGESAYDLGRVYLATELQKMSPSQ